MTRRTTLPGALALLFTLAGAAPAVHAQSAAKPIADSGVVFLGPGQALRISVVSGATAAASVRFRRVEYFQGGCNATVCTLTAGPQAAPEAVTLNPGEGASLEIRGGAAGVRGIVTSESRGLKVAIHVVDATTGQIIAILIG